MGITEFSFSCLNSVFCETLLLLNLMVLSAVGLAWHTEETNFTLRVCVCVLGGQVSVRACVRACIWWRRTGGGVSEARLPSF